MNKNSFIVGKRKTHTVKSLVIISMLGIILFCSRTEAGRIHDKTIVEKIKTDKPVKCMADLGFYGYKVEHISLQLPQKN